MDQAVSVPAPIRPDDEIIDQPFKIGDKLADRDRPVARAIVNQDLHGRGSARCRAGTELDMVSGGDETTALERTEQFPKIAEELRARRRDPESEIQRVEPDGLGLRGHTGYAQRAMRQEGPGRS